MEVLIPYKNAKKISYSILCMGAGLVIEIILAVFTNKMGELKVLLVNIKLSSWKKYVELSIVVFSCFFVSIYITDEIEKVFSKMQYKVLIVSCCFILGNILGGIGKYYEIFFPFRLDTALVMGMFIFLAYYTRKYIINLET